MGGVIEAVSAGAGAEEEMLVKSASGDGETSGLSGCYFEGEESDERNYTRDENRGADDEAEETARQYRVRGVGAIQQPQTKAEGHQRNEINGESVGAADEGWREGGTEEGWDGE